jgi:hypothetical protein
MKTLDTTNLDLSNAFIVSEDQLQNRFLRIDLDTYAFTVTWQREAVLAFHSRAFSALLNWMETRIVDFAVFKLHCLQNPKDFTFFEVCILGEAGRAFKIDSRGCIEELTALNEICGEPEGVFQPSERWSIKPEFPYDRLLVSNSLGQSWEKYFDQGSPKELLDHLWHEYTREREDSGPRAVHDLNSEFGPFCAVESVCGRIVFVTTVEGLFVGRPSEGDDQL